MILRRAPQAVLGREDARERHAAQSGDELAGMCEVLEYQETFSDAQDLAAKLGALQAEYAQVRAAVEAQLADLASAEAGV